MIYSGYYPGLDLSGSNSIDPSGTVDGSHGSGPGGAGGVAVQQDAGSLGNAGTISGGNGYKDANHTGTGGNGGIGIDVGGGGTLTNNTGGIINGGVGGATYGGYGGNGGVGVELVTGGKLSNAGTIQGGAGDAYYRYFASYYSGTGGAGVELVSGGSLDNSGTIEGGYGGYGRPNGAAGAGVSLDDGGALTNNAGGIIRGGAASDGYVGAAGAGVSLANGGTLINNGGIISGGGGHLEFLTGSSGGAGVSLVAGGTLTNNTDGTITGGSGGTGLESQGGTGGTGVSLAQGSTLTNNTGGIITGGDGGMGGPGASAGPGGTGVSLANGSTLMNAGSINGGASGAAGGGQDIPGGAGVYVSSGGNLSNSGNIRGGGIYKGVGVELVTGASVSNAGNIIGSTGTAAVDGFGVDLNGGGTLTNTGTIMGGAGEFGYGADLSGGTLSNAGTISGGGGTDAVRLEGNSTLIVEAGAVFNGRVIAVGSNNLLELGADKGPGTLLGSRIGSEYFDFTELQIQAGATWDLSGTTTLASYTTLTNDGTLSEAASDRLTLSGSVTGTGVIELDPTTVTLNGAVGAGQTVDFVGSGDRLNLGSPTQFAGSLAGFNTNDTIDLTSLAPGSVTGHSFNSSSDVLTLDLSGGGSVDLQFSGNFSGDFFHAKTDGGAGVLISEDTTPCYCPGTLILTPCGEVAVEDLSIGDWVTTHSGEAEPIKWIGRRSYAGRFLAGQRHSLPIRIHANALADGVPRRDLWVSPLHALYLDRCLIPAGELVNGISITQESVDQVHYFHLELDSHALIYAEGATTETFVDDNSRMLFDNAEEYERLYPGEGRMLAQFCAERLSDGYEVEMIRWRLADRAETLWPSRTSRAA